jgi:hypothetical protein
MSDVQYQRGKHIKNNGETHRKKGCVYKKQPDLADRHIQLISQVGTNTKTLFFKKGYCLLKHPDINWLTPDLGFI